MRGPEVRSCPRFLNLTAPVSCRSRFLRALASTTTFHVIGCRDILEHREAGRVGQGFGYFLKFRTVHGCTLKCSEVIALPPERSLSTREDSRKPATEYFDGHLNIKSFQN